MKRNQQSLFGRVKNLKKISIVFMLVLVLAVVDGTFCFAADNVKIGVPLPLTGRHSPFGQHIKRAFQLAVDEINAAGGVRGGRDLELVFEDSQSNTANSVNIVQKLIEDEDIIMLTGQYSSSETYPAAGLAERNRIPFVVSTAAADKITESGWKYVFRTCQPASEFDSGLQDFMLRVAKPKSMVILYENTLFGTSVAKNMKKWAEDNGIQVKIFEDYEAGVIDFKPMLFKVKAANPDVVYAISYLMDATLITRQMKEIDLNPRMFAGSAAGYSISEYLTGSGKAANYVYSSTMWEKTIKYKGAMEFYNKYKNRFKVLPPYHAAQGYIAAFVCADAINRASSLTRKAVRDALVDTNLSTMYGPIKFISYKKYQRQNRLSTLVLQVQNGQFEIVWPADVSTSKAVFPVPRWSER